MPLTAIIVILICLSAHELYFQVRKLESKQMHCFQNARISQACEEPDRQMERVFFSALLAEVIEVGTGQGGVITRIPFAGGGGKGPFQQTWALIEPNSLMASGCASFLHLEVFKKPVVNCTDINLL